jgi:hypothetical protein
LDFAVEETVSNSILREQSENFHKSSPINNCLTLQPILANNVGRPIDSAQKSEAHENIKNAETLIVREQLGSFPII